MRTVTSAIMVSEMTERPIDVVRGVLESASRLRDPSGRLVDLLDPETTAVIFETVDPAVEWHEDPKFPETGV